MNVWKIYNWLRFYKDRLITKLWYKLLLEKLGNGCLIESPLYLHNPDYIEIGDNVSIGPLCRIEAHPIDVIKSINPFLQIGNGVSIQHSVHIYCHELLIIGDNALIASGCLITDNNHGMDPEGDSYLSQPLVSSKTVIGNGVWLGENVCVLAGSVIGEKSIIGANSVVIGTIPPFSIAVGTPARVVKRYCFETNQWIKVEK